MGNRRTGVPAGYFMHASTMIHDDGDDDVTTGINNLCARLRNFCVRTSDILNFNIRSSYQVLEKQRDQIMRRSI